MERKLGLKFVVESNGHLGCGDNHKRGWGYEN